jgi:hypothetical protein
LCFTGSAIDGAFSNFLRGHFLCSPEATSEDVKPKKEANIDDDSSSDSSVKILEILERPPDRDIETPFSVKAKNPYEASLVFDNYKLIRTPASFTFKAKYRLTQSDVRAVDCCPAVISDTILAILGDAHVEPINDVVPFLSITQGRLPGEC